MRQFFISFILLSAVSLPAQAAMTGEKSLLKLCDEFGETKAECACYFNEVKKIYSSNDIALSGSVAKSFLSGQEPESIAAYLLLTRKITVSRANQMYRLGDKHSGRVGKMCEDKSQIMTPKVKAKRDAMTTRLEKIAKRYRVGQ